MKNRFTQIIKTTLFAGSGLMLLFTLMLSLFQTAKAQAPYCSNTYQVICTQYYMDIGALRVTDGANNILFDKADDKCNNRTSLPNYSMMSTSPSFNLSTGQTYTMGLTTGPTYAIHIGVWIDLNGDLDFSDAGEWVSKGWSDITAGTTTLQNRSFTLSCSGTPVKAGATRMRVMSEYYGQGAFSQNSACGQSYYGETEDYTVALSLPTTIQAGFFMPDTAFINTTVSLVNTNGPGSGYLAHQWDINDDNSIEYTTVHAKHKFTTEGKFCVRLKSQNCLGRDSILKCIQIVEPKSKPISDFVSDKNVVSIFDEFNLTDLSTNGPIYWSWYMYDKDDSINTHLDGNSFPAFEGGDDTYNKDPNVFTAKNIPGFPDIGLYTVCLRASNSKGDFPYVCKKDYIRITRGTVYEMGPGTVTSIPGNVITVTTGSIKNKDNGSGRYTTPEANLDALIAPCAAGKITLVFEKWKVLSNVRLEIFAGTDASGTPLHPSGGFTMTNSPMGKKIISNTGSMYFLWNSTTGPVDSGFLASWTTEIGAKIPPTAKFEVADTLYNSVLAHFENKSLNSIGDVKYFWTIDGVVEDNREDLNTIFYSNGSYNVCLKVITCIGDDTYCKTVIVAPPNSPTKLDFIADNRRPKTGEKVTITPIHDKANMFRWTFFPATSVSIVTPSDPNTGVIEVKFNAPGKYTVSLKAWNYVDSASSLKTLIKDQYVIVVSYCTPVIGVTTSSDVAISRVRLEDNANPANMLIDNMDINNNLYTDFTEKVKAAVLTFGGTYNLTINRETSVNEMNRKVWIDWNIDGDFEDAQELVAYESFNKTPAYSASFKVPDNSITFEGTTRMRVGVSYKFDPNEPCGAVSGVKNANRIGEFEDYAVKIVNDKNTPLLTLNGADTLYLELNKTYPEYGAKAWDPTEGDISSKVTLVSDVDMSLTGIYYVTYSVKDAGGNMAASVTRVVYVVIDQTPPVLTLDNEGNTIYIEVFGKYTEPGYKASDSRDGDLLTAVVINGSVNTNVVGTYILTYCVQDAQSNRTCKTRTVIVRDTEKPVIINNDIEVKAGVNVVKIQLQSVIGFVDRTFVTDNYYDVPLVATPGSNGEALVDTRLKGSTDVTYTATDGSGNTTTLIIRYIVEDYIAPRINLNTLDTVYHMVNKPYTPIEANAEDNLYDESEISLTRTSNVNPFVLGLWKDTYTATDASGNVATRNRWVRVYDGIAPEIKGKQGNVIRCGLWSNFMSIDYLQFSDNYDNPTTLKNNAILVYNDINTYVEGTYSATFRTVDNSGNMSTPFVLIIVVDRDYERIGTGINELNTENVMNVYPNPTTGVITVKFSDWVINETASVSILDAAGREVKTIDMNNNMSGTQVIDMDELLNGVYTVRVTRNSSKRPTRNSRIILRR